MNNVYIVSAVRTPIGSFGGKLAGFSATELGSKAIAGALDKAGVDPSVIQEVLMGNVISSNLGQAPAKQASIGAGIPNTVPTTLINKVCASGMKATMLGAQSIMLGMNDLVVAGGMESMSNIPFYVPKARWGYKYGGGEFVDGLERDGLKDAYDHNAMGVCADATAAKYQISREAQDAFAIRSYQLAAESTASGLLGKEIVPVSIPQRKGDAVMMTEDEEFRNVMFDKIPSLRAVFTKDGTVTAANASTINDGASALVLASEKAVKEHNLTPVARIVSFADASHEPQWFTTAPAKAAPIALQRAGLTLQDMDYFEVNEAFAVVVLAFNQAMGLDPEKVNVFGGAVSLGHPLGASGARILTTLNNVLHHHQGKYGLAAICNGGGGASAMIIERV
ncbi:MAG: acetyl-CoA C-acyltransferase [Lewinellaceae bacterium]|nr:acetyl-CoA C-acyltransferase [Saprospiraceae bacterium]MCB9314105.1 acetyl-CoA C-acyltransferase [Lewinellaceae bacterium]HRW76247.1 acetyl-CoA C-acyltransferase [Saprospiraceae bacterium]